MSLIMKRQFQPVRLKNMSAITSAMGREGTLMCMSAPSLTANLSCLTITKLYCLCKRVPVCASRLTRDDHGPDVHVPGTGDDLEAVLLKAAITQVGPDVHEPMRCSEHGGTDELPLRCPASLRDGLGAEPCCRHGDEGSASCLMQAAQ